MINNNKGFGKFEVLTVIVLLMVIFSYLLYSLLGNTKQKFDTMKKNAVSFSKTVNANSNTFHNTEVAYLGEAIDEKLIGSVKNPFGRGNCSESESKVVIENDLPRVTFRCGKYLIDNASFSTNYHKVEIYEVSDWHEKKQANDNDKQVLYNCKVKGKEKYPEYYEELYFVSRINKDYDSSHYFASSINDECKVVSKTFYRSKKLVKE